MIAKIYSVFRRILTIILVASPFLALIIPCHAADVPNFIDGSLSRKLGREMNIYVKGRQFNSNWLYKGKLSRQFQDVFTMSDDHPTMRLANGLYLTIGYRYQDATNRGAMVVSGSAHIYLAAIAQADVFFPDGRQGLPQLRILVRDPRNLRYLPAIEQWAKHQPDMHGYVMTLYNLNCKARNIEQCKMAAPAGTGSTPAPAH